MATNYTWGSDHPTGVPKNHYLSAQIRDAAIASTLFVPFAKVEPGYGKQKGESVTIQRISNISVPTTGVLTEGVKIPEDSFSVTSKAITVSEFGRAVPYTSLANDLASFDLRNAVQRKLKDQMALILDNACAAAIKGTDTKVKYAPTSVSAGTFDTDGTQSTTATANMNYYHLEQIRDYLYGTLQAPMINGYYIGIFATKACRGLKQDPAFVEWNKYISPEKKATGEIGMIEGVRIIECNNSSALSNGVGTGSVLGEGVVFGEDAFAMAVVQDPELRLGLPGDFGRSQSVAWYGILNFSVIWDTATAGEARLVVVNSA